MNTVLVLSPHLDDAAFSVGPLLAMLSRRTEVVVATVFTQTKAKPTGFALACQLDKGISAEVDYMAIRRKEDSEWAEKIGVTPIYGPFFEAPHRGYQSAAALFGPVLDTDQIKDSLKTWLAHLTNTLVPSAIFCPIGIGSHVDHVWVSKVAEESFNQKFPLFFFKDLPYSSKISTLATHDYLNAGHAWRETQIFLQSTSVTHALVAAEAYSTQIPFQFGTAEHMKSTLRQGWENCFAVFHAEETSISDLIVYKTLLGDLCLV